VLPLAVAAISETCQVAGLSQLTIHTHAMQLCSKRFGQIVNAIHFSLTHSLTSKNQVKAERRRKGISPELPPFEERAEIKAAYMATKPS